MTTVAASSKLLLIAADTAASVGERVERSGSKLYRHKDFIAGFAGALQDIGRLRDWMRAGCSGKPPRGQYDALLLYRDGRLVHIENGNREDVVEEYYSIGSGSDFAFAALDTMRELGLPTDPRIAVKVACHRDKSSRDPITEMRWRPRK